MAGTYTFKKATATSIGTTPVTVYTNPNPLSTVMIGLAIGNKNATSIQVDLEVAGVQVVKGTDVPAGAALDVVLQAGKLVLESGDTVVVTSDTADSATCILGVMEET